MDISVLRRAGLTESQAKGYLALVEFGALSPTELSEKTGESRTNAYAITDKLVALGLAIKTDDVKNKYRATHPSSVESLAERRRKIITQDEKAVKQALPGLIDFFYQHSELPGTRTLQGEDGIKSVYKDTLATKSDIYLVRTTADLPYLGEDFLNKYRQDRANLGINTYALTPDTDMARQFQSSGEDQKMLFHRTFLPANTYTAPVEIDIYGDKVAFIAFGETQMATIIDSPPIAEAMRQLVKLLSQSI